MTDHWLSVTPRYDEESDSILLIDGRDEVLAKLHRNAVIRMVGMLPAEPPRRKDHVS